jgi:hypothetical protein
MQAPTSTASRMATTTSLSLLVLFADLSFLLPTLFSQPFSHTAMLESPILVTTSGVLSLHQKKKEKGVTYQ